MPRNNLINQSNISVLGIQFKATCCTVISAGTCWPSQYETVEGTCVGKGNRASGGIMLSLRNNTKICDLPWPQLEQAIYYYKNNDTI